MAKGLTSIKTVNLLRDLRHGYGLYKDATLPGNPWKLTCGCAVKSDIARRAIARGYVGNQTMGFYRITDAGLAALAEYDRQQADAG